MVGPQNIDFRGGPCFLSLFAETIKTSVIPFSAVAT